MVCFPSTAFAQRGLALSHHLGAWALAIDCISLPLPAPPSPPLAFSPRARTRRSNFICSQHTEERHETYARPFRCASPCLRPRSVAVHGITKREKRDPPRQAAFTMAELGTTGQLDRTMAIEVTRSGPLLVVWTAFTATAMSA